MFVLLKSVRRNGTELPNRQMLMKIGFIALYLAQSSSSSYSRQLSKNRQFHAPPWDESWESSRFGNQCVDLPKNLSLCWGIGYTKMRLPNLLDHESMSEVYQQSNSWTGLLNVRCDKDTKRFLCSLFCPVCLETEEPIYPCRSLCQKVKSGCEGRMNSYGFPWPSMFSCDKFPEDNDMCIMSEERDNPQEKSCKVCTQFDNAVENIKDHYCQADFVVRGKFKKFLKGKFIFKRVKILKNINGTNILKKKTQNLSVEPGERCCEEKITLNRSISHLIMGSYGRKKLIPTLILQWDSNQAKISDANNNNPVDMDEYRTRCLVGRVALTNYCSAMKKIFRSLKRSNCSSAHYKSPPKVTTSLPTLLHHSKRKRKKNRKNNNSTDATVKKQPKLKLKNGIRPII